jgi:hypothetical protein
MHLLRTIFTAVFLLTTSLALTVPGADTNSTHPHLHLHISKLDKLCREIKRLDHLVNELNATGIQNHHPQLNLTALPALLANASAELNSLTKNATLERLCKRARQVEHDCFPLVGPGWRWEAANATDGVGGEWWNNSTWANGTDMVIPNTTAVADAKKNGTLVAMCDAWVRRMTTGNLSETDAGE